VIGWGLVILALVAGIDGAWPVAPIRHPAGVLAPREPVQTIVTAGRPPIVVSQGSRFYYYRWSGSGPPLPPPIMVEHSANMHLIPSSSAVWRQLKSVRAGHVVRFSGYLVSARADDGWRWDSSLTRQDSGPGACELVGVEAVSFTGR
jgi:hypothetical protein